MTYLSENTEDYDNDYERYHKHNYYSVIISYAILVLAMFVGIMSDSATTPPATITLSMTMLFTWGFWICIYHTAIVTALFIILGDRKNGLKLIVMAVFIIIYHTFYVYVNCIMNLKEPLPKNPLVLVYYIHSSLSLMLTTTGVVYGGYWYLTNY